MSSAKKPARPTPEEMIEKVQELQWMYDHKLFPPERMHIIKDVLDLFKPMPTVH